MRIILMRSRHLLPLLVLALVLPLSACAAANRSGEQVVVSFYPLQYVAQRVVGSHATVTNMTKPGVEPHELELRPSQIADIASADVVLYEKGLAPSFDDAVAQNKPEHVVDTTTSVPLRQGDGGLD